MSSWLEPPRDETERALREGLELARRRRGDEVARRRLWSRLSGMEETLAAPAPAGRRRTIAAGLACAASVLLVLLAWRSGPGEDRPAPEPLTAAAPAAATTSSQGGGVAEGAREAARLLGVGAHRTKTRERIRGRLADGAVVQLEPSSELVVDAREAPLVKYGLVGFDVPRQPPGHRFTVNAGAFEVVVVGTKFQVRVDGAHVGVDVEEGLVEVWRDGLRLRRVPAGRRWSSPAAPAGGAERTERAPASRGGAGRRVAALDEPRPPAAVPSAPSGPAGPPAPDSFREAQAALASGQVDRALTMLAALSRGDGPAAENAAYEHGRILRDHLLRPREALRVWQRYRTRFPHGLLRAEADISTLETLVALGAQEAALAEAEAFLGRHPSSERRAEVVRLAERLRAAREASRGR
jgi:ferric-dicitrate binding protein FerR (iron transport regulator)